MLLASDFQTVSSVQATVFTPGFSLALPKILPELFQLRPERFDGDPMVLPLPPDAPLEIPRVTLKTADESMKFEVSPSRVNFFALGLKSGSSLDIAASLAFGSELLRDYLKFTQGNCGRMAAIVTRLAHNDNPPAAISSHFCKESFTKRAINEPAAFEIHSLKKYKYKERFDVNSWVRVKSAMLVDTSQAVILIQQDINTLAELADNKAYSEEEFSLFFDNVHRELDNILTLYFFAGDPGRNEVH